MSEREFALANHVLASIRNDLIFLKDNQLLSQATFDDIQRLLPVNARSPQKENYGYPKPPNPAPAYPTRNSNVPPSGYSPQVQAPPPPYVSPTSIKFAKALYDYNGQTPDDLSFRAGDRIQVTDESNNDWWQGLLNGKKGCFPRTYVELEKNYPSVSPSIPEPDTKQARPPQQYPPQQQSPPRMNKERLSYDGYPSFYPQQSYSVPGGPPPSQVQHNPPTQQYFGPPSGQPNYNSPPPAQEAGASGSGSSKMPGMLKKVGGKVAEAATWGFGATVGSDLAHTLL